MIKLYRIQRLHTLSKGGSLVFCGNCKKILGSINKSAYRYINMAINCDCGNNGTIEIAHTDSTSDPREFVKKMPFEKNSVSICKKCNTPLFSVIGSRITSYSFYVECKCGEKYDLESTYSKRLGETLKKYNEL